MSSIADRSVICIDLIYYNSERKRYMRKKVLICVSVFMLMLAGCGKEDTLQSPKTDDVFGVEKGIAAGIADFSEDEPEISIKNIVTYVGKEIDYSTGIEVSNTEKYEDFQMWVDASAVDIHTVGSYEAVYRFVYGDKTKEIKVIVSVIENTETANEPSGDSIASGQVNNGNGNGSSGNNNGGNSVGNNNGNGSAGNNSAGNVNEGNNGGNNAGGNGSNNGGGNGDVNNNNGGQNKTDVTQSPDIPNPTAGNTANPTQNSTAQTTTARRQIVTSSGQIDTKTYSLGYMNIELLSGSVVKIKCTSSKYIVSTHTELSTAEKNGVNYNVYKLVVTYNTGAQQVLETYEEKIN